jgi:hypothetical protein
MTTSAELDAMARVFGQRLRELQIRERAIEEREHAIAVREREATEMLAKIDIALSRIECRI